MEKTTISQLKARLSAYLKKVRAGQTLSLERLRAAAPRPKASVLEALLEERRSGR